ncbi:MAG TPA: hypothetical protein VFJ87_03595 [Rhodanobacteraceae bacterium]|nr:hypothetical protein [Rhodanobacteraceae bacterium]
MDVALANAAHCIGEPRAALSREQQVNGVVHLHEGEGMQAVPEARRGQAAKTMPALIVENDDTLVNAELGDVQARRAGSDNACACKNRRANSDDAMADIRAHVQQQKVLGDSRFQAEIEAILDRKVAVRPRGRPRKTAQGGKADEPSLALPFRKMNLTPFSSAGRIARGMIRRQLLRPLLLVGGRCRSS